MNSHWQTVIVDDEKLARDRLKRLLDDYKDVFRVIGEASDGDEAMHLIESQKPDIVFLDVQMPGRNVFEMLSDIQHKPFVVFCTAFDHFALEAFQSHSVDYLIKPVDSERLKLTVEKLNKITTKSNDDSINIVLDAVKKMESRHEPTSVPHRVAGKTILVKLEQVVYFEANEKYVNFYNPEGKRFIYDQSLTTLEERLPSNFIRVSRSVILNRDFVNEIHKYFRGSSVFVMHDINKTKIISGRTFNDTVKQAFDL